MIKLRAPTRCVIHYRQKNYFIDPDGSISQTSNQGSSAMKIIVEYANGDPNKASLLSLIQSDRTLDIVINYGNPEHKNYEVVGYKIRR